MNQPLSPKRTRKYFRTGVISVVLSSMLLFSAPTAHAQTWGTVNIFSDLMMNIMQNIQRQIEGAILGTLKMTAISMLNSQVGRMIGGTSVGDALFITDWYDFLYTQPAEQVHLYMNDFFTLSTRGKFSSANYVGIGDVAGSVAGNYPQYLVSRAQQSIASQESDYDFQYDLDQYASNPEAMFQEGDWRGFNAYFSNPANNPFGYTIYAETRYAGAMNQAIDRARTEAQSSGFIGKKQGGRTITPAATIENMMSDVQNIGNNMIAAATNPGEFLAGVVGSVVNRAVSNLIQNGIGKIQASIQKEIRNVDNQVVGALNKVNKQLGPAAAFTRDVSQKTNVYIKPYTVPPPSPVGTGSYAY